MACTRAPWVDKKVDRPGTTSRKSSNAETMKFDLKYINFGSSMLQNHFKPIKNPKFQKKTQKPNPKINKTRPKTQFGLPTQISATEIKFRPGRPKTGPNSKKKKKIGSPQTRPETSLSVFSTRLPPSPHLPLCSLSRFRPTLPFFGQPALLEASSPLELLSGWAYSTPSPPCRGLFRPGPGWCDSNPAPSSRAAAGLLLQPDLLYFGQQLCISACASTGSSCCCYNSACTSLFQTPTANTSPKMEFSARN